jgi:heme exporter protein B
VSAPLEVFRRDLRLAARRRADSALVLAFFAVTVSLFPLGVGPGPQTLSRLAAGVIWVAALLSVLLSLERLFAADWEDGSLDLFVLAPAPLEAVVLAKCAAHWLATGLPLALAAPVLAVTMNLEPAALPVLVGALLLGTPTLTLVGAIGAALTLGARRGGVLVALLVLPLYVPVLIFGVGAVEAAAVGLGARPYLLILGALLAAALPLAPLATAAALRLTLE